MPRLSFPHMEPLENKGPSIRSTRALSKRYSDIFSDALSHPVEQILHFMNLQTESDAGKARQQLNKLELNA